MREGRRDYGLQIEIRCWDSIDARIATPTRLSYDILDTLTKRIITEVPGVVSVTYNITPKPPLNHGGSLIDTKLGYLSLFANLKRNYSNS